MPNGSPQKTKREKPEPTMTMPELARYLQVLPGDILKMPTLMALIFDLRTGKKAQGERASRWWRIRLRDYNAWVEPRREPAPSGAAA